MVMKMPWGKTVRGRQTSQLMLVDGRNNPRWQGWVLLAVGMEDRTSARVGLTRKGLVALRNACTTAIALDKEEA